ncbi:MAG: hypothetical protein HY203_00570 [Nitrospirae bacterium]|nr:hypothetical protein [Nitrospirota bacterium]
MTIEKKKPKRKDGSFWQSGLVNGRLAEVFFSNGRILGYCLVDATEYKTRKEKRWIAEDTQKLQLTYKNKEYHDRLSGKKLPQARPINLRSRKLSGPSKNFEELIQSLRNQKVKIT